MLGPYTSMPTSKQHKHSQLKDSSTLWQVLRPVAPYLSFSSGTPSLAIGPATVLFLEMHNKEYIRIW